ncbi:hypothetical protein SynMEDNS5_02176 [Synechococcus sp. MEDNS5]|uniref:sulfotransferase n=1 Tax=Synechococcus sp. MEDNS5 TaxID=1442554 RepID=UPI0016443C19|nr:sulfotransferase [Synechococcus sp. MEDNS5]QNJ06879.1 hypothetical protein SynMEDNS5_02176 [Synechococcus sp. MEDNS5]
MEKTTILALPRSGTTSIFSILENFGSKNEYLEEESVDIFSRYRLNGNANNFDKILIDHVKKRWMLSNMKVDAASFNFMCPSHIHEVYPNMRYIYLLREPISWIESFVSMLLYYRTIFGSQEMPIWMSNYGKIYSLSFDWEKLYECTLETRTPYAELLIKDLINFWYTEHKNLLSFCKDKNTLYLETNMISNSLGSIGNFLGIDTSLLSKNTHVNKGRGKKYFLSISEKQYIKKIANAILEHYSFLRENQSL